MVSALAELNQAVLGRMNSTAERAGEFMQYARLLAASPDDPLGALNVAEHAGAPDRVLLCLRSAAAAGTTTDPSWASSLAAYRVMAAGFLQSLATASVFDAMLAGGMRRVPLKTKIVVFTTALSGSAVGEGTVKPVSQATLTAPAVEPRKAACIVVMSDELLRLGSPPAVQLFNAELKQGVVRATDTVFVGSLIAGTTPTASAGSSAANVITDIGTLLGALSMGAESKPFIIMNQPTARGLTLKLSATGDTAFPDMGLFGGEIVNGLPVLVSDQCPADFVLAVDAASVIGDSDTVVVDASRYSTVDMGGPPDSPPSAGTNVLSLWQQNLSGLRAERLFGFSVARAGAVAALSGVAW